MKRLFAGLMTALQVTAICLLGMAAPVGAAFAVTLPTAAINSVVDGVQGELVTYVVGTAMTTFFGALTWIGLKLKIKVTEYFNRSAMELAAKRYANDMIDVLQQRMLGTSALPQVGDLVRAGVDYIKTGNPDAVKESKISPDRLATIVRGALNTKAEDLAKILVSQRSPS